MEKKKRNIVFDSYTGEVIAACTTKEVKQIVQIQEKFAEGTLYEIFKLNEHKVLPDDIAGRKRLELKDVK